MQPTQRIADGPVAPGPVLLERGVLSRGRLWQQSLQQARRTVDVPTSWLDRTRVRLGSVLSPDRTVFIIGCPRSGTTYLGELLSALPEASYYFEPQIFKYYVRLLVERRISTRHARALYQFGMRSLLLAAPGSGRRPIEKNPNHVFAAAALADFFPDATFVCITRDGRDVALSLSEKPWHRAEAAGSGLREPGGYAFGPYPHFYIEPERAAEYEATSDLHRCIWIWRRHQEVIETLPELIGQGRVHGLRYEDLVLQPERTLDDLLDFLDATPEGRQAVFAKAAEGSSSSVGRWRTAFDADDLATIDREAGELLRSVGYA